MVTKLSIGHGHGTENSGPDATFDEATFSTVGRSVAWLLASYQNQNQVPLI